MRSSGGRAQRGGTVGYVGWPADVPNPWMLRPVGWSLSSAERMPTAYVFTPQWIEVHRGDQIERRPAEVRAIQLVLRGDGDVRDRAREHLVIEFYDGSTIHVPDMPPGVRVMRTTLDRCYRARGDVGARRAANVHHRFFARGSTHPFGWYFEGASSVEASSVDDVLRRLRGFRFENDHAGDQWRHPVEMERLGHGDCEDHALWAWRKLTESGHDAELVVGQRTTWHAWVHVMIDGVRHLLEATLKSEPMIWPLQDKLGEYVPRYGVDGALQTYLYGR